MSTNAEIGLSRKQRVFALVESVFGTLQLPVGTTDFIRPAGNAMISQNPAFADSEELQNTLDVLDRFEGALPPGKWSIPMYLRPSGTVGSVPQGACLLRSLQGSINAATTAIIATSVASATFGTITLSTIAGGTLPEVGVVRITDAAAAYEDVRYTGITRTSRSATTATLTGCVRDYGGAGTAAGTFTMNVSTVALRSIFYKQATTSPSLSIWVETDHLVQGLKGASVSDATFEMSNDGGVKITFSGEGMQMVWAGTTTCAGAAATAATGCKVTNASLFSVGAYVYDSTKATGGNLISSIDLVNNTLYFDALSTNWASGDTVCGYLPTGTLIGDVVEAKDTVAKISGTLTKIKTGSLSVKAPKKYLSDEIGTDYAEDFLEDKREITSQLKLYFKKADASYFADGMASEENTMHIQFGDTAGYILDLFFPRAFLEVPTVEFNAPALELSVPMKALGTVGEDSLDIVVC